MRKMRQHFFMVTGALFILSTVTLAALKKRSDEVPLIPRELLFGNPEKSGARLSPDGKQLSFIAPVKGVLNIWVQTLGKSDARPVTWDTGRGIRSYLWCYDNEHMLYIQDKDGDENWHLYRLHLKTKKVVDLTPFPGVRAGIVKYHKSQPTTLLVSLNKRDAAFFDVYKLDLISGSLELVEENSGDIGEWHADDQLQVRLCTRLTNDGESEVLHKKGGNWELLRRYTFEDTSTSGFAGFGPGNTLYFCESTGVNASRLLQYDLETGKEVILAEDPTYDICGFRCHPDTKQLLYYVFSREKAERVIVDQAYAEDFNNIEKTEPDCEFSLVGHTVDYTKWLIVYHSDRSWGKYYLYDRASKTARFLFAVTPQLKSYTLAPMEPISCKARDGLSLYGYLTKPAYGHGPWPLVLDVHGGPWVRDHWGYNPEVQWLANRGYAVLQINYRGSSGYGKQFLHAGNKEWGRKMQHDLTDAVRWAIAKGIADPKKVAIYGGSYGGYAALAGAAFTPDLYCCGVDIVGPSNLLTLMNSIPPYWKIGYKIMKMQVGDPETEKELLWDRSPLAHVDSIKIPLLIAQGANDPRVKQAEAEQIVAALKKKGLPHAYLLYKDEGHGFERPENRLHFYAKAEEFLSQHLGGRYEGKA